MTAKPATLQGEALLNEIKQEPAAGSVRLWYIGQMGLILRKGSLTVLIDPVLNDLTDSEGKTRRLYPPLFAPEALDFTDFVLCTHNHADHLNLFTLLPISRVNPEPRFIVPAPEAHVLTEGGIPESRVIEAEAGVPVRLSEDCTVLPVAAAHEDYRRDAAGREFCLGYHLTLGSFRLYHAGDTLLTDRLLADLRAAGVPDAACLPVNGRDDERHARGILGNMNAEEAACLAASLGIPLSIPMHYDMVRGNTADPQDFARACLAKPERPACRILRPGESLSF